MLLRDALCVKNKITAIISTYDMPLPVLAWTVFALLLKTRPNHILEHIIVNITGPDPRCGDVTLQNNKEQFLSELRALKWHWAEEPDNIKDMPITIMRTWSRVGHGHAIESTIPWVHTEAFLLLHDDVIVEKNWDATIEQSFLMHDDIAAAICYPMLMDTMHKEEENNRKYLHLSCSQSLFRIIP